MLSPALAPPPPSPRPPAESSNNLIPTSATRRRGLSYLRSLSSRDHSSPANSGSADPPRVSPRHFFTRSTSYQETKNNSASDGRKRSASHSRLRGPAAASAASLVRVASDQGAEAPPTATQPASVHSDDMTRTRPSSSRRQTSELMPDAAPMARPVSGTAANGEGPDAKTGLPTIRFFPHQDHNRLGRQSLNFTPISRTLPNEGSIIRVGRYSEREGPPAANPSGPSDAAVGFKSKVVSRKHCEFSFTDGQWQIRDVASSSGTFLNHIRLSQPNSESRLYPIKDGDIVQLGIDFRGGEEMIFRCVKIRIECNRSWQKKPNLFNKQRQAQIRGLSKDQPAANANSGECSICLGNVLVSRSISATFSMLTHFQPCQALFVAPCAHVWHYKCIRPMLEGRNSQYPQFQCPNCRAYTDLEADVDIDMEAWAEEEESADQDKDLETDQHNRPGSQAHPEIVSDEEEAGPAATNGDPHGEDTQVADAPPAPQTTNSTSSLLSRRQDRTSLPENNLSPTLNGILMPARPTETEMQDHLAQQRTEIESPSADQIIAGEGPLTPRNNAGPFVFDGSGSSRRQLDIPHQSLDEISDGIE